MSTPPEGVQPGDPAPRKALPDDALPPVHAPTAGFILQLFVIPMLIVAAVVVVSLMFGWLAQIGTDPETLVSGMKRGNASAWQNASTLANLLNDPQQKHLRYDRSLAGALAELLDAQIDEAGTSPEQINLRVFLCRALGEFHLSDGLPVLIRAATEQRDPAEIDVRRTAFEAIAVLATNVGSDELRDNKTLMKAISAAIAERGVGNADREQFIKLRERAAFVLGVIGGQEALDRLVLALEDPSANVRYNAATGLARHGDVRAVDMLVEMLDPDNPYAVEGEHALAKDRKRVTVIKNGIFATEKLIESNPAADRRQLIAALENLIDSEMTQIGQHKVKNPIRLQARGVLKRLQATLADASGV